MKGSNEDCLGVSSVFSVNVKVNVNVKIAINELLHLSLNSSNFR